MSTNSATVSRTKPPVGSVIEPEAVRWRTRLGRALAFRKVSALYLLGFMIVVFSIWVPETFLTTGVWRSLLSSQAITCLVAIGLVAPVAAGVIDLAIGSQVGLSTILVARLLVGELPIPAAILAALCVGAAVGTLSWLLVTRARIPAFIATLGVSSILVAATAWLSDSQQILNLPPEFATLGTGQLFGFTYPFYIMIAVAFMLWYVLERTPAGRRVYATGGNVGAMGGSSEAATLAGVRTSRVILGALISSGMVAALAGVLLASQLSVGDPTAGPAYLLPVIAAIFFGSTQFHVGRFNIWGTVVAAYTLAVGVKGLQLAGLPLWIPELFNGTALLVAVGMAVWRRRDTTRREAFLRLIRNNTTGARAGRRTRRAALHARVTEAEVAASLQVDGTRTAVATGGDTRSARLRRTVAFRNNSAIYLLVIMIAIYALWVPETFLTLGTWRSLLSDQAVTCLVAIALVVPTAAGAIDLAIGAQVGLGAILVSRLLSDGTPVALAVAISLGVGAGLGVLSWLLITRARIPAFIATLGVSSILIAGVTMISDGEQITDLPPAFAKLGTGELFGLKYTFYVMLVVAVLIWYAMEHTPSGRRIYATGSDPKAAALAGIRTSRVVLGALVTSGVVAALAGVLVTARLSVGDPTIGPSYLLPVIAAIFFGCTQFRAGRFNVWGTVVAAYTLAVGVKGLQLAGLPIWTTDLFNGSALLLAVGLAAWRGRPRPRLVAWRRPPDAKPAQAGASPS